MNSLILSANFRSVPHTRRWLVVLALLIALIGLGGFGLSRREPDLGVRGFVRDDQLVVDWVAPGSWAWDGGVRPGDTVVAIDGGPTTRADAARLRQAGNLEVLDDSGGRRMVDRAEAAVALRRRAVTFLPLAVFFATLGSTVFVLSTELVPALMFLVWSLLASTAFLASIAAAYDTTWALALTFVAIVCFGASTLGLFLVFPVNYLAERWGRWALAASIGASVAVLALYTDTLAGGVDYAVTQQAAFFVVGSSLLASVGALGSTLHSGWSTRREERRLVLLIALGAVAGFLPFALLSLAPHVLGVGYLVPPRISILSLGLLPLCLAVALLSRQFLGISRLVRRSLVALLVWVGLLSAYSLGGLVVRDVLRQRGDPLAAPSLTLLSVVIVAASFWPLQQGVRHALEQLLFHDVYDYAATLRRLSDELAQRQCVDAITSYVLWELSATLDIAWATITLEAPAERYHAGNDPPPSCAPSLCLPLLTEGHHVGWLLVGEKRHDVELLAEDRDLLITLAPMLATALQSARLLRSLAEQVAALAERETALSDLSAKLLRVQEDERKHLALELHDDPLQRAIFLARELDRGERGPHARAVVDEIITSLRAICSGLRPPILDDFGLVAGLEALANEVRARSDLTVTLVIEPPDWESFGRLEPELEVALYRVAQEALNNSLKHAQAGCVAVRLTRAHAGVVLQIADDGQGFCTEAAANHDVHLGLLGMRERLQPWRGSITFEPHAPGGMVVTAQAPWESQNE